MQLIARRVVAALALVLTLTACSDGDSGRAADAAPTAASATPTSTPSGHPAFEPTAYTYDLTVQCFCQGTGVPVEVTVEAGEVADAVYAQDDTGRSGVRAGDPADERFRLTINDVIDLSEDSTAARVEVDWPAGQDYPNSVLIDGSEDIADDEIGYSISNVRT